MLLVAGFAAFQLGKNEVNPILQLVVAAVVALIVAIQLVPHGPLHVRKPDLDLPASSVHEDKTYAALLKRAYSPPRLTQFESREFSEPAWESPAEDDSFRDLRPFYVIYPRHNFIAIAASLKFHGDKDYMDWQPVANSTSPPSQSGNPDERHQWILIAYVPPNAASSTPSSNSAIRDPGSASPCFEISSPPRIGRFNLSTSKSLRPPSSSPPPPPNNPIDIRGKELADSRQSTADPFDKLTPGSQRQGKRKSNAEALRTQRFAEAAGRGEVHFWEGRTGA